MQNLKDIFRRVENVLLKRESEVDRRGRYLAEDARAASTRPPLTEPLLREYVAAMAQHPDYEFIRAAKRISMLHEEVLLLLRYFVLSSQGAVVEIGPYIGGSTVVLAKTAQQFNKGPVITIEPGGRHEAHPHIPSTDIFGDLTRNLSSFGVSESVTLIQGWSCDPAVYSAVTGAVADGKIDLLFIDADGHVGRDFDMYAPYLKEGAVLVFDDYRAPAEEKAALVKDWVDEAVASGKVRSLGVWGWGTWIGLYDDIDNQH